jgi:hypothetical protein
MTTLRTPLTRPEWTFGLAWVLATAVGWAIGFAICVAFKNFVESFRSDGAVIGTCIGITQWLVFRRRSNRVGWWVLASIVGFAIGKAIGDQITQGVSGPIGAALAGAAIGAALGVAQWLVLRRKVAQAGWWVVGTTIAWTLGWSIISTVDETVGGPNATVYLVGGAGAALAGVITAATLIWFFRLRPA